MNRRSTLYGDFSRVKTLMGLERFEVRSPFRPILKSLEIYEGIGFEENSTFAVFFRSRS